MPFSCFGHNTQITAQVVEGNNEETVHHAVSFAAQNTYLGLPQMKVYNSINIRLQFRTFEQNGLIFFNAGKASDFIALELVKGRLYYVLNLGYGPISIKDNTSDMVRIQPQDFWNVYYSLSSGPFVRQQMAYRHNWETFEVQAYANGGRPYCHGHHAR